VASIAQEESRNISENVKWGKRKKYADGYTSCAYKNFLGYDKHPSDAKKGFIINEEQAVIVREIYRQFLKGMTLNGIADLLMEKGIKTPTGKDMWWSSTIESILTNEKYKGDACIRKTYVKDFLTHQHVKNNGEVESYYVEEHHDPIINPDEWETVQVEMRRRKELGGAYSSTGIFASRLVCGDCGAFYGQKVWHSNDKYRKLVFRCNDKFNKNHAQCTTPTVDEKTIKEKFMEAYTKFMADRKKVVDDCKDMIAILCDTASLEKEIEESTKRANEIIVLVEDLIGRNSTEAMPQEDFQRKYNEYDEEHQKLLGRIGKCEDAIQEKQAKAKNLQVFVRDLETKPSVLDEWDDDIWHFLVDKATVNSDGTITFQFRNGKEISA